MLPCECLEIGMNCSKVQAGYMKRLKYHGSCSSKLISWAEYILFPRQRKGVQNDFYSWEKCLCTGSCRNWVWENTLAVKSLLVQKGKFRKHSYFQLPQSNRGLGWWTLANLKPGTYFRLQHCWASCIIRELEKLPFLVTQQSLSECKVFFQRCQEEEGLFCADGRLTELWVESLRSSFQEVQQATGEPQAPLPSS